MVEAARARPDREALRRLLAACLVGVLLFTGEAAAAPEPAQARGFRSHAATIRERQQSAERAMRRADGQILRLQRSRSEHGRPEAGAMRRFERALDRRRHADRKADRILDRLVTARAQRDRTLLVRPSPSGRQIVDRPALRKRVEKLRRQLDRQARVSARADRRVDRARGAKHRHIRHASASRVAARRRERERAEALLSQQITLMLSVAKERAERRVSRSERRGFRRPSQGTVSQGYGCQHRSRGKRGRRACVRFHDGVDIATRRGAPVRASAAGYVAYVGWNPWDHGRRAFVVIIGHRRGFETIYAHLKPKRKVKAGQRVRRGQAIGVVGLTGRTSGAHVHWEVSRGFRTLDPRRAGR